MSMIIPAFGGGVVLFSGGGMGGDVESVPQDSRPVIYYFCAAFMEENLTDSSRFL